MKKMLLVFAALAVLLVFAGSGLFVYLERIVDKVGKLTDSATFVVPKGAHASSIGKALVAKGLIDDERVWRYHIKRRGGLKLMAGRYELKAGMSMRDIANTLEQAPLPEDVALKVLEGWRLRDTDAALTEKGWIKAGDYIKQASQTQQFKAAFTLPATSLEGYLYPETYAVVPQPFDVKSLIQRQLDTFSERFYQQHKTEISKSSRSLHELVTMASMLEREEPTPAQRPVVAGILYKRIDSNTPLGVDATSRYELDEWNDRTEFLKHLRDQTDPYNSRYKKGLPPTPIGAPSIESLVAALRPVAGPYWYYLHDSNKVLHPSKNAAEHEALRKKYNVY